jgi:hypothetical protein
MCSHVMQQLTQLFSEPSALNVPIEQDRATKGDSEAMPTHSTSCAAGVLGHLPCAIAGYQLVPLCSAVHQSNRKTQVVISGHSGRL